MAQQAPRYRRRIRNYLIDRNVQLRFSLAMVALTSALTAVLGFIWYAEMRKASEVVRVNALSVLGNAATRQLEAQLAAQDQTRLLVLVGFGLLLALLITSYGIVMTHKLAGPLFKINRHIDDIEAGRLYKLWPLRKGDLLQQFFASFKKMHGALRARTEEDMRLLSGLITAIEGGDDLTAQLPTLKQTLKTKGDSLRDASEVTQKIDRPPEG